MPSMNQGGPNPATGHPGFAAVGIPALRCFAMLECNDAVRAQRLPPVFAGGAATCHELKASRCRSQICVASEWRVGLEIRKVGEER